MVFSDMEIGDIIDVVSKMNHEIFVGTGEDDDVPLIDVVVDGVYCAVCFMENQLWNSDIDGREWIKEGVKVGEEYREPFEPWLRREFNGLMKRLFKIPAL